MAVSARGTQIISKAPHAERVANERAFNLKSIIKDVIANGSMYVRSPETVRDVMKEDPNITKEYDNEDDLYILRYNYSNQND